MSDNQSARKSCFVIGPIGEEHSAERTLADWLLDGIIKPVLEKDPFNYEVKRADDFTTPGLITDQVIAAVIESDLVVADLTGPNPNAFYELAIRHMEEKPVIHVIHVGQVVPFDNKDYRTVFYSREKVSDITKAQTTLAEQVRSVSEASYRATNPITKARGHQKLARSSDPKDQVVANMIGQFEALHQRMSKLEQDIRIINDFVFLKNLQPRSQAFSAVEHLTGERPKPPDAELLGLLGLLADKSDNK